MTELLERLPRYVSAHLALTLAALGVGIVVSLPLGVLASRRPRLAKAILGAASVLQTIPSLALLAVMVPLLAALGAPSIGYLPAFLGLLLYCLLPMIRNTAVAFAGLDPAVLEAARGVGMTPREQLLRVELPLALPVIVAGIRTAAVLTVGTATLATPVGALSLGEYIFGGLQTRNFTSVMIGCVASAALALTLDGLLATLLRPSRAARSAGLFGLLALAAATLITPLRALVAPSALPAVTIGAKTFTEQFILSRVLALQVTRATGVPTRELDSLGSTVAFDALRSNQIDAYVDYSGTIWATVLGHADTDADAGPGADRGLVLDQVTRELAARFGVVVVAAIGFENTYALSMRRAQADRLHVHRLSELTPVAKDLRMGGDYEIFQRPEWHSIERAYGLAFRERRSMDPSLLYEAVRADEVDVISAFSTDGRIVAYDLVTLEDDRHAIPPYDAIILASARLASTHPEVIEALRGLAGSIDPAHMRRMNAAVDDAKETPSAVAERFLREMAGAK